MALTRRQRQIAKAIGRDPQVSYAQIGRELGIAEGTVRNYVHELAEKTPNPYGLSPKALVTLLVKQWEEQKSA